MARRFLLPFRGKFTDNFFLERHPGFAEFLAQGSLIFLYDGLEPTNGLVERISIIIEYHSAKIIDLKRIVVLDSLSLFLEPLIINLDCLGFSAGIEFDFEFAYAVKWGTNAACDSIFRSSSTTSTSSGGSGICRVVS